MEDKKMQETNAQEPDKQKIDSEELENISGGCWLWDHDYVKTGRSKTSFAKLGVHPSLFDKYLIYEFKCSKCGDTIWRHLS